MNRAGICRHIELDIDQTRRLRSWPMHSGSRRPWRNSGGVNDKVSYLAVEHICRNPVQVFGIVRVSINQTKPLKIAGGLQNWAVARVADHLREVRGDDRR